MNTHPQSKLRRIVLLAVALVVSLGTTTAQQPPNPHQTNPDTLELDLRVGAAAAKAQASGATAADRQAAAAAYVARGNVYYNAGQPRLYKYALGDFRRALQLQPDLVEAREKIAQIEDIYHSLGRPVPDNGAETAPELNVAAARRLDTGGAPPAQATGRLDKGRREDFSFNVKGGQHLHIELTTDSTEMRFNVYELRGDVPIRRALEVANWNGEVSADAVFVVRLLASATRAADYKLAIMTGPVVPQRSF